MQVYMYRIMSALDVPLLLSLSLPLSVVLVVWRLLHIFSLEFSPSQLLWWELCFSLWGHKNDSNITTTNNNNSITTTLSNRLVEANTPIIAAAVDVVILLLWCHVLFSLLLIVWKAENTQWVHIQIHIFHNNNNSRSSKKNWKFLISLKLSQEAFKHNILNKPTISHPSTHSSTKIGSSPLRSSHCLAFYVLCPAMLFFLYR